MSDERKEEMTVTGEKKTVSSPAEYKMLVDRLAKIEGQVRGVRGMMEKNATCPQILAQVSAATAALNSFSRELLSIHIRDSLIYDVRNGNEAVVYELLSSLQKLMK